MEDSSTQETRDVPPDLRGQLHLSVPCNEVDMSWGLLGHTDISCKLQEAGPHVQKSERDDVNAERIPGEKEGHMSYQD